MPDPHARPDRGNVVLVVRVPMTVMVQHRDIDGSDHIGNRRFHIKPVWLPKLYDPRDVATGEILEVSINEVSKSAVSWPAFLANADRVDTPTSLYPPSPMFGKTKSILIRKFSL